MEAPWRNGKTERAIEDWKEDYNKMTHDGPEAQTWTDLEEDCDAVNQARASNINDSGYSAYQRVFGRNPPQMEEECGGADQGVVSRQQSREVTQERSICPPSVAWPWNTDVAGNEPCTMQRNTTRLNYMLDKPFGSGEVDRIHARMTHWKQLCSQSRLNYCEASATRRRTPVQPSATIAWDPRSAVEPAREKKKRSGGTNNLLTSEGRPPINPVDIFSSHVRSTPVITKPVGCTWTHSRSMVKVPIASPKKVTSPVQCSPFVVGRCNRSGQNVNSEF